MENNVISIVPRKIGDVGYSSLRLKSQNIPVELPPFFSVLQFQENISFTLFVVYCWIAENKNHINIRRSRFKWHLLVCLKFPKARSKLIICWRYIFSVILSHTTSLYLLFFCDVTHYGMPLPVSNVMTWASMSSIKDYGI